MYRGQTVGVVVPAYNEAGLVGTVIETIPSYVDRIYAIDDCSTDDTWAEILASAKRVNERGEESQPDQVRPDQSEEASPVQADGGLRFTQRVCPIQHGRNRGVGGAIKTGYRRALEDRLDITAVMGGDGQMDPDILHRFLDPIVDGEADYTKGNRLLDREYRSEMPTVRVVGNGILTALTKVASGYWKTMDPQNGYTAISYTALDAVAVDDLYEFYGYCNDLLVKLNARDMRVADVAMAAKYDAAESSISYPSYIPNVSGMLVRNFLWRLTTKHLVRDFHPLALFYLVGAGTLGLGVLASLWSLALAVTAGGSLFAGSVASLLVCLVGVTLLLFATVFDMRESAHRERQIHH